jgi:hypothetical protein
MVSGRQCNGARNQDLDLSSTLRLESARHDSHSANIKLRREVKVGFKVQRLWEPTHGPPCTDASPGRLLYRRARASNRGFAILIRRARGARCRLETASCTQEPSRCDERRECVSSVGLCECVHGRRARTTRGRAHTPYHGAHRLHTRLTRLTGATGPRPRPARPASASAHGMDTLLRKLYFLTLYPTRGPGDFRVARTVHAVYPPPGHCVSPPGPRGSPPGSSGPHARALQNFYYNRTRVGEV